jgi:hypothetical protein
MASVSSSENTASRPDSWQPSPLTTKAESTDSRFVSHKGLTICADEPGDTPEIGHKSS